MRAACVVALASVSWCAGAPPPAPEEPEPQASSQGGVEALPPSNKEEGDPLELNVPLVGGGELSLASLRGGCVLVEISATWEAGFEEVHARFDPWAQQWAGAQLAIVSINVDEELASEDAFVPEPDSRIYLGWDPQGAVAAQVRAATFPTYFVLDLEGRVSAVLADWEPETLRALEAALDSACAEAANS